MTKKGYVVGSGNVFADIEHPRPAEALAKAELARKIAALIARRGLTQAAAAELLEVDQLKVSALTRGRLAGFSLDRLVRFLVLLPSFRRVRETYLAEHGVWASKAKSSPAESVLAIASTLPPFAQSCQDTSTARH